MSASNVMLGMSYISYVLFPKTPEEFGFHSVQLLTGEYDLQIKAAGLQVLHGKIYRDAQELEAPDVKAYLERIKSMVRNIIEDLFIKDDEDFKSKQKQQLEATKKKLLDSNKPHTQGTVAELATKLGVSKSEVRRMKTEGTLDAALNKLEIQK